MFILILSSIYPSNSLRKGTAYTPVSLPAPKKLVNPFAQLQSQQQSNTQTSVTPSSTGKKLTWSERQALAKKQQAEEEERGRAASFQPAPTSSAGVGMRAPTLSIPPPPQAPPAPPAPPVNATSDDWEDEEAEEAPAPPPPPPPPPAATRPVPIVTREQEPEQESEFEAPPPPPVNFSFHVLIF